MLNRFNSNAKKLNRSIPTNIKGNTLEGDAYIAYLESIKVETTSETPKGNVRTRSNPNPTQTKNNKNKINNFRTEILQYGARYAQRSIDEFNNVLNTITIYNVFLDYGTEEPTSDNFEILMFGLHIPGNFQIKQNGNNVVITLHDRYIDFDSVTINDIYVIGKFK